MASRSMHQHKPVSILLGNEKQQDCIVVVGMDFPYCLTKGDGLCQPSERDCARCPSNVVRVKEHARGEANRVSIAVNQVFVTPIMARQTRSLVETPFW